MDSVPSGGSEAIARRQDHRPAQDWRQVRAHRRVGRSDRRRQQQGGGRQQRLVDGVLGGHRIVAATAAVATAAAVVGATDAAVAADVVVVRSLKTCDSSSRAWTNQKLKSNEENPSFAYLFGWRRITLTSQLWKMQPVDPISDVRMFDQADQLPAWERLKSLLSVWYSYKN